MPLLSGISHIATVTDDLDRLVDFYRRVFDAEVLFDMDEDGLRHAGIRVAGTLMLHPFERPSGGGVASTKMFSRGRIDHYGLDVASVADLLEIRRRLLAEGVTDGEVLDFGPVYSLHFTDPDGVHLEVNCMKGDWNDHPLLPRRDWQVVDLAATG